MFQFNKSFLFFVNLYIVMQTQGKVPEEINEHRSILDKIQLLAFKQEIKCVRNQKALYTCINKKCTTPNSFICPDQDCECILLHEQCSQIRIRSFLKIYDRKNQFVSQIQQKLNQKTDRLIDQISGLRDKLLLNLKEGNSENIFGKYLKDSSLNKFISQIEEKELEANDLNGFLMGSIWQADKEIQQTKSKNSASEYVSKVMDSLTETIRKDFVSITNLMIIKQHLKCNWSPTLKGLGQIVQGKSVKKGSGNDRYTFLVPSLTKMNASIFKWKFNITKVQGWVGLGIGIRRIVEKNKFDFLNYTQAEHGGYIISSNGYAWAHNNKAQNAIPGKGLQILSGQTVSFQLDLKAKLLKFKNETTSLAGEMTVVGSNLQQSDQYYLCTCLGSVGDEVQLVSIEADNSTIEFDQKYSLVNQN